MVCAMTYANFRYRAKAWISIFRLAHGALLIAFFGLTSVASAQVEYKGGPTMQGPITVFLIFWEPTTPTPFFYDSSTSTSDANYRTIIPQFFTNLTPSSYFNILTQYYGACNSNSSNSCVVANAQGSVTVGGTFQDPRPYPHPGSQQEPLQDSDIRDEIQFAMAQPQNNWTASINTEFFVFTTAGIQECNQFGCTFSSSQGPAFCGYHDSFGSGPIIYAYIPDPACIAPSPAPNQKSTDSAISSAAHEFLETVSDPLGNHNDGWLDKAGEIADRCQGLTPPTLSDGSDVSMFGNPYIVPFIFSNDNLQCVLSFGPTVQLTASTGDDDLRFDSQLTATLSGTSGPFQGVTFKTLTQPTWADRTSQVRVFGINQTQLSSVGLTMAPGDLGHDEWKLAALDVRILDPLGNLLCDQDLTANPGPLADMKFGATTASFATPNCAATAPPPAWDSIEFQIRTGNDNAQDGSEVTASVAGQNAAFCLKPSTSSSMVDFVCPQNGSGAKDQQGNSTWNNFTNSDQTFSLSPTESSTSSFSTVTVSFRNNSGDNWDIEGISVTVFNSKGPTPPRTTLINIGNLTGGSSDDCLARLKTPSDSTQATFGMDGSHVYADGKAAGQITNCKNNGDNQ